MDLFELKKKVAQGEGQQLEFKKKANYPEKIIKELVAFANAEGGTLILGVDDDGTLSGTRNIEGEAFVVTEAIRKWVRPQLPYELEVFNINAKKGIAIFDIEEGHKKPYAVLDATGNGKKTTYIRLKDESLQASREMREIIRRRQSNKDIQFEYGEKERLLMQYLEEHESISLSDFSKLAGLSKYVASRTLVRLVLANVLDIQAGGDQDCYRLKFTE